MSVNTSFKLNTGATIPAVGLGTWQAKPGEVQKAVVTALKAGYRHIDGAFAYQNEEEVGKGIKESGVPREEIFVTSKLWGTFHDRAEEGLNQTLTALGLDYLDLYLIHWPVRLVPDPSDAKKLVPTHPDGSRHTDFDWDQAKTWAQMEALQASGKVKAIGICNAGIPILEHIIKTGKIVPAVNQIEIHPYNPQHELIEYCKSKNIVVEAYSPLGSTSSPLHDDAELKAIAEKHKVTTATVLISWSVNKGIVVLPKSVTPSRIEQNLNVIKLDQEDIDKLSKIAEGGKQKRFTAPPWGSDFGHPDWYGPNNKDAPAGARLLYGKSG